MRDEVEVTDFHEAGLMQYLGYLCIVCRVSGQDSKWTFRGVKEFDAQIVNEEFNSDETSVLLRGFIKALNEVASFQNKARRSLEGAWYSDRYKEARTSGI